MINLFYVGIAWERLDLAMKTFKSQTSIAARARVAKILNDVLVAQGVAAIRKNRRGKFKQLVIAYHV